MGTAGVPFKYPDRSVIVETLKAEKGRMVRAAKRLGMHYETLRKYTDPDPELVELISNLRHDFDERLLDQAEDVLKFAMNQTKLDLGNALKASFFALNNKGKSRGYSFNAHKQVEEPTDDVVTTVQDINSASRDTAISGSKLASEQPLLDQRPAGKESAVPSKLGAEDSLDRLFPV